MFQHGSKHLCRLKGLLGFPQLARSSEHQKYEHYYPHEQCRNQGERCSEVPRTFVSWTSDDIHQGHHQCEEYQENVC